MQRLPQCARHGETETGANFFHPGCDLLQVPRGQAGAICLRARSRKGRRMPVMPSDARWAESPHAEAEQRELALPAVPHDIQF